MPRTTTTFIRVIRVIRVIWGRRGSCGESDGWWGEEQEEEVPCVGRSERRGGWGGMVGAVVHCVVEGERHGVDKHCGVVEYEVGNVCKTGVLMATL